MSYWDHASFYDDSVLVTVKIAYRLMQYDEVLTILHAFYDELDFDAKEISEKAEVAFAHFYLESLLRRWEEVIASDFHDGEISTYSLGHIMRVAGLVLGVLDRLGDRLELLIEKDRVPKNSTPKKSFFFGRKKAENPKMVIQKSIAPINRFEALTLFCQMGVLLDKALLLIDKIEALLKSVGALLLVGSVYSLFEFNVKDFLAAMALGVFGVGAGGLGLMVAGVKQLYVKLLRFYANDYKFIYDSKTDDTPALIALLGDAWYIKANLERRSGKVANAEYAYYRAKAIYAEPLFLTDAQKLISVLAGLAHLHAAQNDTSMKKLACQEFEAVIHLQNEIYGKGVHLAVYEIKRAWLSTYGQLITQEKFSNTKDKERYTQEYIKMCYEYKEFFKKSTKFNQIIGGMSEALKGNFVNLDIDWDKDEQPIAALNAGAWQHAVALSRKKLKEDNDVENITSALGTLLDVFATNTPAKNKLTAGKTTSQLNCKAGKAVQLLLNDIANWLVDEGYHDLYKNLSDLVDVAVGSVPVNNTLIDARAFIIVLIDFCFPIRTFDMAFTLRWFSMILKCQDHILQADACDETATLLLAAEVCETSSTHTTTTVGFFPPATPLSTQTSEAANPMLLASSKTVNHK